MASKKYTWVAAIALAITCGVTTAAHADPDKVAYELSERCGERAEKMFNDQKISGVISTYESHYNAKLNGCFAVTWAWHADSMKSWELYDVNENHRLALASCVVRRRGVAEPADDCVSADVQTPPASDVEFRAALQRYMER